MFPVAALGVSPRSAQAEETAPRLPPGVKPALPTPPDPRVTGRELLAELTRRRVDVSYYGVWHFLDHTGLSVKKACAPLNRTVPTSLAGAASGRSRKVKSRPHGSSLSTRLGPGPT
jgi:hypothetical protein